MKNSYRIDVIMRGHIHIKAPNAEQAIALGHEILGSTGPVARATAEGVVKGSDRFNDAAVLRREVRIDDFIIGWNTFSVHEVEA